MLVATGQFHNSKGQHMKRPTIRTAAEAAGIVTLLASLVFLAMEINQSNKIAIASVQYDILSDFNEYHRQVLADPEVAEFISKLEYANDTALSPAENTRAHAFVTIFINLWFAIQTAHDNGQLTDGDFQVYLEDARHAMHRYPRAVPYFKASIESAPSLRDVEIFQPIFEANESPSQ
jgi:hypothetical protein